MNTLEVEDENGIGLNACASTELLDGAVIRIIAGALHNTTEVSSEVSVDVAMHKSHKME